MATTVSENLLDETARGVVQVQTSTSSAVATGTTVMPLDDTIPQNTEGDQYMTVTITPKNASNTLVITVSTFLAHTFNNNTQVLALFQDSTAAALAATIQFTGANGGTMSAATLRHSMTAGTTSATTFKFRMGGGSAGTTTMNGTGSGRQMGGVAATTMTVVEYTP